MWNPLRSLFKKSEGEATPAQRQTNRVEELVNTLQRTGRTQELESELAKLDQAQLSPAEQEFWWRMYGIIAFRAGRDDEALKRFEEGYKRFPGSAQIRFSLGQQYIRARSIEKGFELFRTCKFPEVPSQYVLAMARYAYLYGRYNDGLSFVRPLFDAYKQVKVLDGHFLYVRGLPFFGESWAYLAAFSILVGDLEELESVTKFVAANCHDYDFDFLQAEYKAHTGDAPELLLPMLENRLKILPQSDSPTGYTRMNMAVIQARSAATFEAARETLASVVLSERDFPWLQDIRTLATAEAANRFGDTVSERKHVDAFLARQPMLFEPDIALNFHLLRYQEKLKPRTILGNDAR